MNGIAIFQAHQASKLVLFGPNWIYCCYLSIFVEIVQIFSQPMRLDHFTDFFYSTQKCVLEPHIFFPNDLTYSKTIKSIGFILFAYSTATYDHFSSDFIVLYRHAESCQYATFILNPFFFFMDKGVVYSRNFQMAT